MPITDQQKAAAQVVQHTAAHDNREAVRVIAGPGTGKSSCIEEKVLYLLEQGADPKTIAAVSFTRASAKDLRSRITLYCGGKGHAEATDVRVSTLHSLAMSILKKAGQLNMYPVRPLVLDDWEVDNVFDAEFGRKANIASAKRQEAIRKDMEAFWTTDEWNPSNYIQPKEPITEDERKAFTAFHGQRSQLYACVLPGEVIRRCVKGIEAGTLNPVELFDIQHLIVDEFQDLNPMDLTFVNQLVKAGVRLFVAGDDDQSIYSFRFASPHGIQAFHEHYQGCGQHSLSACFRSTPAITMSATTLIEAYPGPNRIKKQLNSLYAESDPVVDGIVHRLKYKGEKAEAKGIAETCKQFLQYGVHPRDILILISNRRLAKIIVETLAEFGVPCEPPKSDSFTDTPAGRLVLSLIRIACIDTEEESDDDYVAHRVLLGVLPGVGIKTCTSVSDTVLARNLNFKSIFYQSHSAGTFDTRSAKALKRCGDLCAIASQWNADDSIADRKGNIADLLTAEFGEEASSAWLDVVKSLPNDMILTELEGFLRADTDEQQKTILDEVYTRLAQAPPADLLPPKVRMMTMHGAKGLSAHVVFIPALEEYFLPGAKKSQYAGLVLEAARMLYVSITRARAACILSFAKTRMIEGVRQTQAPCRFNDSTGGPFVDAEGGLSDGQVAIIKSTCDNLF